MLVLSVLQLLTEFIWPYEVFESSVTGESLKDITPVWHKYKIQILVFMMNLFVTESMVIIQLTFDACLILR